MARRTIQLLCVTSVFFYCFNLHAMKRKASEDDHDGSSSNSGLHLVNIDDRKTKQAKTDNTPDDREAQFEGDDEADDGANNAADDETNETANGAANNVAEDPGAAATRIAAIAAAAAQAYDQENNEEQLTQTPPDEQELSAEEFLKIQLKAEFKAIRDKIRIQDRDFKKNYPEGKLPEKYLPYVTPKLFTDTDKEGKRQATSGKRVLSNGIRVYFAESPGLLPGEWARNLRQEDDSIARGPSLLQLEKKTEKTEKTEKKTSNSSTLHLSPEDLSQNPNQNFKDFLVALTDGHGNQEIKAPQAQGGKVIRPVNPVDVSKKSLQLLESILPENLAGKTTIAQMVPAIKASFAHEIDVRAPNQVPQHNSPRNVHYELFPTLGAQNTGGSTYTSVGAFNGIGFVIQGGDSKAFVWRKATGQIETLTVLHKPEDADEKRTITQRGGKVGMASGAYRVGGEGVKYPLATSRALGNYGNYLNREFDVLPVKLWKGDRVFIMCDGMYDIGLKNAAMVQIVEGELGAALAKLKKSKASSNSNSISNSISNGDMEMPVGMDTDEQPQLSAEQMDEAGIRAAENTMLEAFKRGTKDNVTFQWFEMPFDLEGNESWDYDNF